MYTRHVTQHERKNANDYEKSKITHRHAKKKFESFKDFEKDSSKMLFTQRKLTENFKLLLRRIFTEIFLPVVESVRTSHYRTMDFIWNTDFRTMKK